MKDRILVVCAHPDDETLGCGGTIRRLADEKHDIRIAILGEGLGARCQAGRKPDTAAIKNAALKAGRILGSREISFFDLPDNRFDSVDLLDIVKKVEDIIGRFKPNIIFTHHCADLNMDHCLTHRAVLTAARPLPANRGIRDIYAFETLSSTEWSFGQYGRQFCPDIFYDITKSYKAKAMALAVYKTEMRKFPHPRSGSAMLANAKKWGSCSGRGLAEAFETIRSIR
ncbi:MAG: PIG-L family deacetylase [Candidatus Omnitrophica bacterium]|jgi:LmbE family N-acetylglucosaminyl deacetylase|nr:PIG-L family deacetylase [Candidatus Omnitrophota bacterium]